MTDSKTTPTPTSRRIVIVGGVAGGASAAARARRLNENAEIILFEKDEHISFANCGLPYHIGGEIAERDKLLLVQPDLMRQRFRIDVRTRQEVTGIDRDRKQVTVSNHATGESYEQGYDKLVLAPGASPIVPPLPGVEAEGVFTLRNVADTDRIVEAIAQRQPRHATVIGAGYIGLEMVEQLHRRGLDLDLVELQPQILPLLDPEMAQPLEQALRAAGVNLHLGDGIKAVATDGGRAIGVTLNSGRTIHTDMVILGIGVRPNNQLAKDAGLDLGEDGGIVTNDCLQTTDPDIYAVGDAAQYPFGPTGGRQRIALAGPANRAGRIAGEHAATDHVHTPMAPVFGTSVVRVFDQTAAMTGLTHKQAERLGIAHQSVTVIAGHHVGYYPGAKPITLKLLFGPETGRVLGAQATGEAGVDKRIDVIATAMAFGATVRDLAGVDLAYAPPFGAAKDPVHMAAFAACNVLDGLVDVVQPGADLDGYQVVDVRSADEVTSKPLPDADHAVNVPLDELRDRLRELDPDRPTVVSCGSGVRSYNAARILMQHGFKEVYNLTGAAAMRRRARATPAPTGGPS